MATCILVCFFMYFCTMIEYASLLKRHKRYQNEIRQAVNRVLDSGWFLLGDETRLFEQEYARFIGCRHAVAVGNGLDALTLIYRAYIEMGNLHPGDEVIVPANTYIASILAIMENGLKPILVEPREDTLQIDDRLIEQLITPRTRSVMVVHLYGRCAYTERIAQLCDKYQLILVEDNAQAHGCRFGKVMTGALGAAAGHSFYPTKNLGALGDAGAITTNDDQLAEVVRHLRNYGSSKKYVFDYQGRNSRMDEIQAAVLRVKLRHLEEDNARRACIAAIYRQRIHHPDVSIPVTMPEGQDVWHIFPVFCQERDSLKACLLQQGIETQVHYPIPPHHQRCMADYHHLSLRITERIHATELSLPIGPELEPEEALQVADAINCFPSCGSK